LRLKKSLSGIEKGRRSSCVQSMGKDFAERAQLRERRGEKSINVEKGILDHVRKGEKKKTKETRLQGQSKEPVRSGKEG